jgi:hypothetical protein
MLTEPSKSAPRIRPYAVSKDRRYLVLQDLASGASASSKLISARAMEDCSDSVLERLVCPVDSLGWDGSE